MLEGVFGVYSFVYLLSDKLLLYRDLFLVVVI